MLAASAIPFIYGNVKIHGRGYRDAGAGYKTLGNVPIEILYEKGYRNIIVSALDNHFNINAIYSSLPERYLNTDFTVLKPLNNIGEILSGTLDISKAGTISRMVYGYINTRKDMTKVNLDFM